MQQNELAKLLDISTAMVSRLAKRGMPIDTLERAQRWRKRHLEPGRIKGVRYNPDSTQVKEPKTEAIGVPAPPRLGFFEIEATGAAVDAAFIRGNHYGAAIRTWQLRELLKRCTDEDSFRLSLRVWLALVGYMVHEDAEVRHAPDAGVLLSPFDFGARVCPANAWPAHTVIYEACDWDDDALNGYPDYQDDDSQSR